MKHYHIIRVAGLHYTSLIDSFYRNNPEIINNSYKQQQTALFNEFISYGNSFSQGMRALGHEAHELVYDLEPMQKRWADENGVSYRPSFWQWDILLSQIDKLRPDILFFQDLYSLPFSIRKNLKSRFSFLKKIVIFRGFPGTTERLFKEMSAADILLVGSPVLAEKCRNAGLDPHLIYHYFDEAILKKIVLPPKQLHDFIFSGSSGFGYGLNHEPRYQALIELLENTPLQVWVDEGGQNVFHPHQRAIKTIIRKTGKHFLQLIAKNILQKCLTISSLPYSFKSIIEMSLTSRTAEHPKSPLKKVYPHKCHNGVFGLEMYQLLANSKITFNRHSAPAAGTGDIVESCG